MNLQMNTLQTDRIAPALHVDVTFKWFRTCKTVIVYCVSEGIQCEEWEIHALRLSWCDT